MIANIRRNKICDLLKKHQAVNTTDLAEKLGVSVETIRKDLLALENEAKLVRVHGGAMIKAANKPYMKLSKRMESMQNEKAEVAALAAKLVNNGDVIAIDSGSTAVELIGALMDRLEDLTIVTHSADVFQRACDYKEFKIILCGGYYLKEENAFYGDFAEDMLDNLRVSKSFVFPSALSIEHGICDNETKLAKMQKKLIAVADEIIILADSSKYGRSALVKVADMKPDYTYVTDSRLSDEAKRVFMENEIKIIAKKEDISEVN